MTNGIPMFYYATESLYKGGNDPANREIFDPFKNKLDDIVVHYVYTLNKLRREYRLYEHSPNFRCEEHSILTFSKGDDVFVAISNSNNKKY